MNYLQCKEILKIGTLFFCGFFAQSSNAELFKCQTEKGFVFTDKPCSQGFIKKGDKWITVKEANKVAAERKRKEEELKRKEEELKIQREKDSQVVGYREATHAEVEKCAHDIILFMRTDDAFFPKYSPRLFEKHAGGGWKITFINGFEDNLAVCTYDANGNILDILYKYYKAIE